MKKSSYYEILNVTRSATKDEIRKAYMELSKKYKSSKDEESLNRIKEIRKAYEVLSVEDKRIAYDSYLDNDKYLFNLSKDKTKNIIIMILILIIIFGGSYVSSELSYYKKNCSLENVDDVSETVNTKFNNIGIEEYLSLLKGESLSLVYIGRQDCSFSQAEDVVFEELLEEYNMDINYLSLDNLDTNGIEALYSSYESFIEDGIATPTIMLVQNNEIKMFKRGYTSKDNLIDLLKENGYIA